MSSQPDSTPSKAAPSLNRRGLWAVLAAAVLFVGGVVVWSAINGRLPFGAPAFHGTVIQSPDVVADFTLTSSTGDQLSLSDLRGKVVLLYFCLLYTSPSPRDRTRSRMPPSA